MLGRSPGEENGYPHQLTLEFRVRVRVRVRVSLKWVAILFLKNLLEELHGQRNLASYSPWGLKE